VINKNEGEFVPRSRDFNIILYQSYINLYQFISIHINSCQFISIYTNLYQIYIHLYQFISNLYQIYVKFISNLYPFISLYIKFISNSYQSTSIYINSFQFTSMYINLYQYIRKIKSKFWTQLYPPQTKVMDPRFLAIKKELIFEQKIFCQNIRLTGASSCNNMGDYCKF